MKNIFITLSIALALAGLAASAHAQGQPLPAPSLVSFPGAPATFTIPMGWRVADRAGDLVALTPGSSAADMLVIANAGLYNDVEEFYEKAAESLRDDLGFEDLRIVQTATPYRVNGMTANSAVVGALNERGQRVPIAVNVVISGKGVGLGTVMLASSSNFQRGLAAVEELLESARFGAAPLPSNTPSPTAPPAVSSGAASGIVGRWSKAAAVNSGNRNSTGGGWSSGSNVYFTFRADGTYDYHYEYYSAIDVPGASALNTDEDDDTGRYTISGGTITLVGRRNGTETMTYRVVDGKYVQLGNAYFERR